mgnify:CR=1 FL=1
MLVHARCSYNFHSAIVACKRYCRYCFVTNVTKNRDVDVTSFFVDSLIKYGDDASMSPMVRRPLGMEMALLGFLRQGSQHGYQIHQMLSDPAGLGPIWRLKQSQLYALLAKLEKDGYIFGELKVQEVAYPPRRMFQLTSLGQSVYQEWINSPVNVPRLIRQEFMAKLYFAQRENKEVVQKLIEQQRVICQNWVSEFNRQLSTCEPGSYRWTMFQYRLGQIVALKKWLESFDYSG